MEEQLPSVFIGSSTEGINVAREVELQLQRDANTTLWENGVFLPGTGNLEP
jgi:predicted nucleotide-binding protein